MKQLKVGRSVVHNDGMAAISLTQTNPSVDRFQYDTDTGSDPHWAWFWCGTETRQLSEKWGKGGGGGGGGLKLHSSSFATE